MPQFFFLCIFFSPGPGERDMIVMQHEIRFLLPGQVEQTTSVGLVAYGDPDGHSAMARTVGYPLGIVAQMILNGKRPWLCV